MSHLAENYRQDFQIAANSVETGLKKREKTALRRSARMFVPSKTTRSVFSNTEPKELRIAYITHSLLN